MGLIFGSSGETDLLLGNLRLVFVVGAELEFETACAWGWLRI